MLAADAIYLLCALTALLCAVLLLRAYVSSRTPLLFWTAICFFGLFLNNVMVLLDLDTFFFRDLPDLSIWRLIPAGLGLAALCYGLVMER